MICIKTSIDNYENIYRFDLLGVVDIACDNSAVNRDLKDQLRRSKDDLYETGLMWKHSSAWMQNNKLGHLERLKNLMWNLQRNKKLFKSYDQIVQKQHAEGIVEKVNNKSKFWPIRIISTIKGSYL